MINSRNPEVLMIETLSGMMPYIIPMGLIDLMNRLNVPKLGLDENEVTPHHIRMAKVIIIPVHWFYSIIPVLSRAAEYKQINPEILIITGGYTATLFDEELIASGQIDYILRGDTEGIFVPFLEALLAGKSVDHFPNLTFRNGKTKTLFIATEEEYGKSNFRDIDWFPSFKRVAMNSQKISEVTYLYPWIAVAKGCIFECKNCMAAPSIHKKFFNRDILFRPSQDIKNDLSYFSKRKDIRHCHFNTDFISLMSEDQSMEIFDGTKYDLECYYECYRYPAEKTAQMLSGSFKKVNLGLFLNPHGECVNEKLVLMGFEDRIFSCFTMLHKLKNIRVILYVDPEIARNNESYARLVLKLNQFPNVRLNRITGDLFPDLTELNPEKINGLYRLLYDLSAKELNKIRRLHRLIIPLFKYLPYIIPSIFRLGSFMFQRELNQMLKKQGYQE